MNIPNHTIKQLDILADKYASSPEVIDLIAELLPHKITQWNTHLNKLEALLAEKTGKHVEPTVLCVNSPLPVPTPDTLPRDATDGPHPDYIYKYAYELKHVLDFFLDFKVLPMYYGVQLGKHYGPRMYTPYPVPIDSVGRFAKSYMLNDNGTKFEYIASGAYVHRETFDRCVKSLPVSKTHPDTESKHPN